MSKRISIDFVFDEDELKEIALNDELTTMSSEDRSSVAESFGQRKNFLSPSHGDTMTSMHPG